MAARGTTAKKERILRVAAGLFARNGYHGTGIVELSEAVGLGKGALYYHINSKEDVLYEISRVYVEELVRSGELIVQRDLPAEEQFRALSRELIRSIVAHLPEWTVFNRDFEALTGHRRKIVIELRELYEQLWRRVLDRGVEQGVFRPLDPIMVKAVIGLHNYTYLWYRPEGALSPDALSERYCDLALEGLRARDRDGRPVAPAASAAAPAA